ncbi:hypothetical protein [Sedimenticola sp.]|uniref:hypothetical protein n=1 Tax=Sedimenticola sp. TaxID=1940285 RepID=UPI003D0988D0
MRHVAPALLVLTLIATSPIAAALCTADDAARIGATGRWAWGGKGDPKTNTSVETIIAQKGPLTILRVITAEEDAIQRHLDVYYGFIYASDIIDLTPRKERSALASLWEGTMPDAAMLNKIEASLKKRQPELVAAMDKLWQNPTPGQHAEYTQYHTDKYKVSIVGNERLNGFSDPDGVTDTLILETESSDGWKERIWFSTEYCQMVRYAYEYQEDKGVEKIHEFQPANRPLPKTYPRTPQALIESQIRAMHLLDTDALTQLTHPDSHANLKTAVIETFKQGQQKALKQIGLELDEETNLSTIEAMSGADLYRLLNAGLLKHTALSGLLMNNAMEIVEIIPDGDRAAEVVTRVTTSLRGKSVVRKVNIRILKTADGGWAIGTHEGQRDEVFKGIGVQLPKM